MSYNIRFHLQSGIHKGHWQIKNNNTGEIVYKDPAECDLFLMNCKLRNQPSKAKKIFEGARKDVCAWIEAQCMMVVSKESADLHGTPIGYNPRKSPHWMCSDTVVDNSKWKAIKTSGRSLQGIAQ